jgi:ketosteroid isomerase-like protein
MRFSICVLAVLAFPLMAVAHNGPCTEQSVKSALAKPDPSLLADDVYFYSGALLKPVVGKQAWRDALKRVDAERKNYKESENPNRIVAAPSGDMAYEYGTAHISYDEAKNGKHNDFTAAYLRVWKTVDGVCKQTAVMYEEVGKL